MDETENVPEDRYEALNLIVKARSDGQSWFDVIHDYITESCEGTDSDEDDCTCGMESMSGAVEQTLEQAYAYTTTVGSGLQPIDLARAIIDLADGFEPDTPTLKVIEWAKKEIEFEEYFENREWETEDEEEEGPVSDEEYLPYFDY